MINLWFILLALLVLSAIVTVHEFGHYIAGRLTGIGIEEFAIGMGPKLISFVRKGIRYSIRAFPIGGFCRFVGEDEENSAENAMNNQAVWKRFVTVLSGPVLNFVLAFLAMFIIVQGLGYYVAVPKIAEVAQGSPAESAGFLAGDLIIEADGEAVDYSEAGIAKTTEYIRAYTGEGDVRFLVERDGETLSISVAPALTDAGIYQIGIVYGGDRLRLGFVEAIGFSSRQVISIFTEMIDGLRGLVFHGEGVEDAMGPIGIVSFIAEEARNGAGTVLMLVVLISMNLGVVNLLPLPALDGGRLLLLIVEGIRKKPLNPEYEGRIHFAGFILLIGVIIFFSYRDILRWITG